MRKVTIDPVYDIGCVVSIYSIILETVYILSLPNTSYIQNSESVDVQNVLNNPSKRSESEVISIVKSRVAGIDDSGDREIVYIAKDDFYIE